MTKETFTKQLKERLEEITECKVIIQTTTKNNGIKLESLTIMREGKNQTSKKSKEINCKLKIFWM